MDKEEEIKRGIRHICFEALGSNSAIQIGIEDKILSYLHSQSVVIKVNCSECDGDGRRQKFFDRTFSNRCPKCNGYGYVAVEPSIKGMG